MADTHKDWTSVQELPVIKCMVPCDCGQWGVMVKRMQCVTPISAWVTTRFVIPLYLIVGLSLATAQGTVTVLNTGKGQPLATQVRTVTIDAFQVQPEVRFNFGFGTDETVTPGTFLDSFTVTIQDASQVFTAVYLTADASGTVLAPPTPGTLPIDSATIESHAIVYSSLDPVFEFENAFQVVAAIPQQFVGGQINVYFDLFDNLDSKASQAWFSDPEVMSVPEPQIWTLLLLGLCLGSFRFTHDIAS